MADTFARALVPVGMMVLLAGCFGGGGGGGNNQALDRSAVSFLAFDQLASGDLTEMRSPEVTDGVGGLLPMTVNYAADVDDEDDVSLGELTQDPSQLRLLFGDEINPLVPANHSILPAAEQARLTVSFPDERQSVVTRFTNEPERLIRAEVGQDFVGNRDAYLNFGNVDGDEDVTDLLTIYAPLFETTPEYMTFGVWALGLENDSVDLGAAAWGNPTPLDLMPSGGVAIYQGGLLGTLVEDGESSLWEAESFIAANFFTSTIALGSEGTRNFETGELRSDLDLTFDEDFFDFGEGLFNPNFDENVIAGNVFFGPVWMEGVDQGETVVGQFGGSFYGPFANEAGGWFETEFGQGTRYFGSFGAKRGLPG